MPSYRPALKANDRVRLAYDITSDGVAYPAGSLGVIVQPVDPKDVRDLAAADEQPVKFDTGRLVAVPSVYLVLHAPPRNEHAGNAALRFDGVYACPHGTYASCLRFHSSGAVVAMTTTAAPSQVAHGLLPGRPHISEGAFMISGSAITFSTRSQSGEVSYFGDICDDATRLDLRGRSHINGRSFEESYQFVAVAGL